jgi:hypothetical protein
VRTGIRHDFRSTIENNKAEAIWAFDYEEDTAQIATNEELKPVGKKYVNPQYYFVVGVGGVRIGKKRESGILKFKDETKIKLVAWPDHPLANVDYDGLIENDSDWTYSGSPIDEPKWDQAHSDPVVRYIDTKTTLDVTREFYFVFNKSGMYYWEN